MGESTFNGVKFTDADVVNPDDFIPAGEYNPNKVLPFLFHDEGFALAVVFAENLQDALDIAADAGKLDRYQVHSDDLKDYADMRADGHPDWDSAHERLAHLGNASEPYDIESLGIMELPAPAFSFCSLFNARE